MCFDKIFDLTAGVYFYFDNEGNERTTNKEKRGKKIGQHNWKERGKQDGTAVKYQNNAQQPASDCKVAPAACSG